MFSLKDSHIFDFLHDAMIVTDLEGHITDWNSSSEKLFGYSKKEVLGKSPSLLHKKEDTEHLTATILEGVSVNGHWEGKINFIRKDGTEGCCLTRVIATHNELGDIDGSLGFNIDISQEEQYQQSLTVSKSRFELLSKATKDPIWDADLISGEIWWDDSYDELFGVRPKSTNNSWDWWHEHIHPDDVAAVKLSVKEAIDSGAEFWSYEYRYRKTNGEYLDIMDRAYISRNNENTPTRILGTMFDLTSRYAIEKKLSYQASHDDLTGLLNRREFELRVNRLLEGFENKQFSTHTLLYLDLDQFKVVNDSCGHVAGDELLLQLSNTLSSSIRGRDTLARLGGDEFGILMENCLLKDAHELAIKLQKGIKESTFVWENKTFHVGVSIGIVAVDSMHCTFNELLKDADTACYIAKDKGRDRIHVYHHDDAELIQRFSEINSLEHIHTALAENRFCLYAQQIQSLRDNKSKHYEILIRMAGDDQKIIAPSYFLPAAERYNLITSIDRWVIEKVFDLLLKNMSFCEQIDFLSINLSGHSVTNPEILNFIIRQLNDKKIPAHKICFEITETAAISNLDNAIKFISTLKELNCQFALDDFGSGLSSFRYLKNLPVDYLKIDGAFIRGITKDIIDHAMVKSINELGQFMGIQTIAEYVENDDIKNSLLDMGVNFAQGFAIHKPELLDEKLMSSIQA